MGNIIQSPVNASGEVNNEDSEEANLNTNMLSGSQLKIKADLCRNC